MAYRDTRICSSLDDFVSTMKEHERPHAFVVGSPAAFRGSTKQGRDFEMQVLKHFPKDTPAVSSGAGAFSPWFLVGLGD